MESTAGTPPQSATSGSTPPCSAQRRVHVDELPKHPKQEELPIAEHGIIGNMQTAALVGVNGSIDYLCFPYFHSPTLFVSILDNEMGGFFRVSPEDGDAKAKQIYWPDTNILISRFLHRNGVAQVSDFMPVRGTMTEWRNGIVRVVEGVRGDLTMRMQCYPAFNYARTKHSLTIEEGEAGPQATFSTPELTVALVARASEGLKKVQLEQKGAGVEATFVIEECERVAFELRWVENPEMASASFVAKQTYFDIFHANVRFWKNWVSQCTYRGHWQEKVYRSALVLKLLTYERSGAILAALTFGLPEALGGVRNWDYRYTWIRDASFTLYALLRIGFKDEAKNFMDFLEARCREFDPNSTHKSPLQVMYGINGEHDLTEHNLEHLRGYDGSRPVWIGNWAWTHLQLDIYGELMDSVYLFNKWGHPVSYDLWTYLQRLVDWVCDNWKRPDMSIWEPPLDKVGNGEGVNFVYSKVMCWVALDRAIRLADRRSFPAPQRQRWLSVRDEIYLDIQTKGWSEKLRAFKIAYEHESLDASHLVMPLVFFMAPNDPRMRSTISKIASATNKGGLVSAGLVYRYSRELFNDGLEGVEGTFNMCTFWLIEALSRSGQLEDARLLFDQMMTYSNHLGLFAEETSSVGLMLGNFPQALTHLALISSAFNLNRASAKEQPQRDSIMTDRSSEV